MVYSIWLALTSVNGMYLKSITNKLVENQGSDI